MTKIFDYLLLILSASYFALYYLVKDIDKYSQYIEEWYTWIVISVLSAVLAVLSTFSVISLIHIYTEKFFDKISSKIPGSIDDIFFKVTLKWIKIAKFIISLYVAYQFLILPDFISGFVDKIFDVSFIFVWIILWNSLINEIFKGYILKLWAMHSLASQLLPFLNKVVVVSIWIIWIITILSNLGYNVWALLAWAWIWGLAFALAAQKSIANIFWAITIILHKPFKIGDFINISWFNWTVKDIWITYLTLLDSSGHIIYIPNDWIISNAIQNYSNRESRRADLAIGVVYDTSEELLEKAVKIIEDILEKYVKEEKLQSYRVNFDAFWDFSLNINTTYFTNELDLVPFLKEKQAINMEIKKNFKESWIEMAFPTQELIIKK